ncbi:MAG: endopolygalacturonase [Candidatus Pacebacteria bacterium]|nr:endopolygalacturonase [Candidatus Paceibacterota bacterium]
MISVKAYGAVGDGRANDAPAIQRALDADAGDVHVPPGTYSIEGPLAIGSETTLRLADKATFRFADGAGPRAGVDGFLITNRDHENGDHAIVIEGGVWDGNNPGNPRGPDGPRDSYTGVPLNFVHVRNLTLRNLTVRDPESFFIRLGEVTDFLVENVTLEAPHIRPNQDGVHIGGYCENGIIRRLHARGAGCPNDDMVAINADDDVTRAINLGMKRGPIRNISVEDIAAEDAYTFVRLLSQDAPIDDIRIRGIRGGCRYYAVNLHRWRFPPGKGRIKGVRIEDVDVCKLPSSHTEALIHATLHVQDLVIDNFRRPSDTRPDVPTFELNNDCTSDVLLIGLTARQYREMNDASTADISRDAVEDPDVYNVRASVTTGDILRLPSGGFDNLEIRST